MEFPECCQKEPYREEALRDRAGTNHTQVEGRGSDLSVSFSSILGDITSSGERRLAPGHLVEVSRPEGLILIPLLPPKALCPDLSI